MNKKTMIIIGVIVAMVLIYIIAPKQKPEEETESSSSSVSQSESEDAVSSESDSAVDSADDASEPEHGTSEYVDYIAALAKADAETATDDELQEAVDWLKDNTTSYFDSEENMEKTMYYGELLEYKYKDTGNEYEQIGWQAFKTVKYVYRGVDSVLDDVTHDNLVELQEMAANISDIK